MRGFMNAQRIFNDFGIIRTDLPMGSRRKHSYFESDCFQLNAAAQHIAIRDIQSLHFERPQQYKKDKEVLSSAITRNVDALNQAIANALDQIKSGSLKFIRTLRIDRKRGQIECVPLIPIKVPSVKQWMAVSFHAHSRYNRGRAQSQMLEISSLYTNCYDIVSKAALVNPDNVYALHWLTGDRPGAVQQTQTQTVQETEQKAMELQQTQTALARMTHMLNESYQFQNQQRENITEQVKSYGLMIGLLQQKEKEIAELQFNLQQASIQLTQAQNQANQQPQAYVAIQIPMASSMPNLPMPMWTGRTPVQTPLASPSGSPLNSYISPATSPSPAMSGAVSTSMPMPFLRLVNTNSNESVTSNGSASSVLSFAERETSPLNKQAEEYVPAKETQMNVNMRLPCLETVQECASLKFEDQICM